MSELMKKAASTEALLPQDQVLPLLQSLPDWGSMVTIVFSGGSVFEFKGTFPTGTLGEGFYNLDGPTPGLHGHLGLARLAHVRFQDKPHRGRDSYAFVFETEDGQVVFKVFLGRDQHGEVLSEQLTRFNRIRNTLTIQPIHLGSNDNL